MSKAKVSSVQETDMGKFAEKNEPDFVFRSWEGLGLDMKTMAACLAVNMKTIERWQKKQADPNEAALRSLEKLAAICDMANNLMKKDVREKWFRSPNPTLRGERPIDLLKRGEFDQVKNVLGMLEWGLYS